ncbi:MAG: peptidase C11 [Lachnospiraceae bacterium]|nr:peptidase C11 [Lachnospiraceae bacterium]
MDNNDRPRSREKNVVEGGKGVYKRGDGLGTGPVGKTDRPEGIKTQQTAVPARGGIGKIGLIIIIILLVIGGKGLLSSDNGSTLDYYGDEADNVSGGGSQSLGGNAAYDDPGYFSAQQTPAADTTVAEGARDKYTVIKGDGSDTVTIMVYMCGTDLESKYGMGTNDLTEMTRADISDKINLIVYTGGCNNWKNNVISSKTNQIYRVRNGQLERLEADMGSEVMTKPATLSGFIKYCAKNYPATRNELILWDHGGGSISGYGYDEKSAMSGAMSLAGINTALADGGVRFDFIGFDACLMATVENALMLEQYGDYMIASEETEPGVGWYYTNWLTELSRDTGKPTVEIGKRITDDFVDVCNQKCPGQKTTLSVVDLAELKATVPSELTDFAKSTNELIKNKEYKQVSDARNNTREFAQSSKIDQVDLVHLCKNMGTAEGSDLARALQGAVKYNRTASCINNAYGLSIYFPYKKAGNVRNAIAAYQQIGMDSEYSKCIQEFAGLEVSGQISAGGASSPMPSLFGSLVGGGSTQPASGGGQDAIMQMLSGLVSGSSGAGAFGFDTSILDFMGGRELSTTATAEYISENYFDPDNLVWTKNSEGQTVIKLPEEQWGLVKDCELNVFYDDGGGYIDLGLDNVFEFDSDGNLIGDYDNTWISINGQPVAYYHLDTVEEGSDYTITGYVPAMLNGDRVELILVFDSNNPYGYIAGARSVYASGETDTVAKSMTSVGEGDVVEFICDYYTYEGEYKDSYYLGEKMILTGHDEIANTDVGEGDVKVMFRMTDIYQQNYWTPELPR